MTIMVSAEDMRAIATKVTRVYGRRKEGQEIADALLADGRNAVPLDEIIAMIEQRRVDEEWCRQTGRAIDLIRALVVGAPTPPAHLFERPKVEVGDTVRIIEHVEPAYIGREARVSWVGEPDTVPPGAKIRNPSGVQLILDGEKLNRVEAFERI